MRIVQYLGCKHQEITTCTELCQQDRKRDKEIPSRHPLLRQLKWLRVEQILYPRDDVMAYKCINGLAPSYLLNKIDRRTQIHNRHTRNRNSLQIPLFKTATGQRTFTYRIASIWNNLSENLKQSTSLNIFKQRLREHLLTIN